VAHKDPNPRREYRREWTRKQRENSPGYQENLNRLARERYAKDRDLVLGYVKKWQRDHPDSVKATAHRKRLAKYGLDETSYQAMLVAQDQACAICRRLFSELPGRAGSASRAVHIDHCHRTGRTRGLLCGACNLGIGKLGDDEAALRRAADYVAR
jgi:hypothetical protein